MELVKRCAKIASATILTAKITPNAVQALISDSVGPTYAVTVPNQAVLPVLLGIEGEFSYDIHATGTWVFRITRTRGSRIFYMPPIVLPTGTSLYYFEFFAHDEDAAANDVYTMGVTFTGSGTPAPTWAISYATITAVYQKR